LLRWLLKEFREWRSASDPKFDRLAAILVVAQVCDFGQELWSLLPDDVENADLVKYFSEFVAKCDFSFFTRGFQKPPIWESEVVAAFLKADSDGDWVNIVGLWSKFPPFFVSAPQTEAGAVGEVVGIGRGAFSGNMRVSLQAARSIG
jgi:hypothetical protein